MNLNYPCEPNEFSNGLDCLGCIACLKLWMLGCETCNFPTTTPSVTVSDDNDKLFTDGLSTELQTPKTEWTITNESLHMWMGILFSVLAMAVLMVSVIACRYCKRNQSNGNTSCAENKVNTCVKKPRASCVKFNVKTNIATAYFEENEVAIKMDADEREENKKKQTDFVRGERNNVEKPTSVQHSHRDEERHVTHPYRETDSGRSGPYKTVLPTCTISSSL
ncbi:uncharacterized protein [Ptychodera flava]|uniref:uncharacterized protein n=1 Tax=Ptychodera flava TaxID=63121 RepID=UPI003969DAA9